MRYKPKSNDPLNYVDVVLKKIRRQKNLNLFKKQESAKYMTEYNMTQQQLNILIDIVAFERNNERYS